VCCELFPIVIEHMFDYDAVMPRYAELHCHTNYSFLDGASWAGELVQRAAELGYEALGVTDHDGFRGAVQVHAHAAEVGLPIVYGTEVGMPRDRDPTDHLVLLAPDPVGYAAIGRFVTRGQYRGRKDAPRYSYSDLSEAASDGNLVALSGCWQGAVPRAAQDGDLLGAMGEAARLKDIFGGSFFLELTNHGMPGDDKRNDMLAEIGVRLDIETVATNNVHYAYRHDVDLSEVLAAIGGRRSLDEADGFRPATDLRHLRTSEEMGMRFNRYPGAVERAADLGRALAFDLDLLAPELPDFPMPGGFTTEEEYLSDLVYEGAASVYPGSEDGISPRARSSQDSSSLHGTLSGSPGHVASTARSGAQALILQCADASTSRVLTPSASGFHSSGSSPTSAEGLLTSISISKPNGARKSFSTAIGGMVESARRWSRMSSHTALAQYSRMWERHSG